ncbi:MAG TPA: TrmH family RNA methyltransferase, partial [Tenuifilaceae bacterium]|nr:TrmH family RNA methyltransferase [Tenuifilaceae bacterium]
TKSYFDIDYTLPTAIVMGAEATGITGIWSEVANANVIIPMRGVTDSLNVSNATAIIIFEALRQRLTL